jgi:hypothetical protein
MNSDISEEAAGQAPEGMAQLDPNAAFSWTNKQAAELNESFGIVTTAVRALQEQQATIQRQGVEHLEGIRRDAVQTAEVINGLQQGMAQLLESLQTMNARSETTAVEFRAALAAQSVRSDQDRAVLEHVVAEVTSLRSSAASAPSQAAGSAAAGGVSTAAAVSGTNRASKAKPKPPAQLTDSIKDKEATRLWIAQMKLFLELSGEDLNSRGAVQVVGLYLAGEAFVWWVENEAGWGNWLDFKTALCIQARIEDNIERARAAYRAVADSKKLSLKDRAAGFRRWVPQLSRQEQSCEDRLLSDFVMNLPEHQVLEVVKAQSQGMIHRWEDAHLMLARVEDRAGLLLGLHQGAGLAARSGGAGPMEVNAVTAPVSGVSDVFRVDPNGASTSRVTGDMLQSYSEVADHSDVLVDVLRAGKMPEGVDRVTVNLVSGEKTYHPASQSFKGPSSGSFSGSGRPQSPGWRPGQQQQQFKPNAAGRGNGGGGRSGGGPQFGGRGGRGSRPSTPGRRNVQCYECGGWGHFADECASGKAAQRYQR